MQWLLAFFGEMNRGGYSGTTTERQPTGLGQAYFWRVGINYLYLIPGTREEWLIVHAHRPVSFLFLRQFLSFFAHR